MRKVGAPRAHARRFPVWLLLRVTLLGAAGIVASLVAIGRAHRRAEERARAEADRAHRALEERTVDAPEIEAPARTPDGDRDDAEGKKENGR